MNDYILEVNSINKKYPTFTLDNVSFKMKKGKIMGFIGRNGAGKTTTLKAIYNLIKLDDGEVIFDNENILDDEEKIKNEIGLLFGGISFYVNKKVKVLTDVTKRFYKNFEDEIYNKWIKYFDIDENKKIKELSNGMKVKYNLALALSHNAKLLLLDEPTSGLDPVSRDEILDCFLDIVTKNDASILFSTHVISDLDKIADDITYIKEGKIIYTGDIDEFKDNYLKVNGDVSSLNNDLKSKIGHCRERKNEFEGIIKKEDKELFKDYKLSFCSLEEIMLFIERGDENEKAPI